jgi:hypothetical protein
MAIFKPASAVSSNGGGDYLGVKPISIFSFTDRSSEFDWADIYISATVKLDNSEYDRFVEIKGSFEKDGNGKITGGSVLNRMYRFFDAIGCTAGLNIDGTWEDSEGNKINDIAQYLNERFVNGNPENASYDHVAYLYKKQPKPGNKAYTTVHYRLFPNNDLGIKDLESHVKWMKGKGFINEATEEVTSSAQVDLALGDNL